MKKFSKIIFICLLVFTFLSCAVKFTNAIDIYYNDVLLQSDQEPVIINSRTFVPIRVISEAFGAKVDYDKVEKSVDIQKDHTHIHIVIDDKNVWISDEEKAGPILLDAPAFIKNGRTMLPLRAISEIFDMEVNWDNNSKSVYIGSGTGDDYLKPTVNEKNAEDEVLYKLRVLGIPTDNCYASEVKDEIINFGTGEYKVDHHGYSVTIRKDNPYDPNLAELVGHYFINDTGTVLMEFNVLKNDYEILSAVN